ncbi:MAG: GNAT family N-acetyltransferase [Propionibacteriaceae bacterium]|nr:GNAT family N-acetyltransferase [Propionibacteriaceae bacterium]
MSVPLVGTVVLRPLALSDASALATAYASNREYLRPWEPVRTDSFFTPEGQHEAVARSLVDVTEGRGAFWLLVDGDRVIGRISLTDIALGAFQSANLGFWVSADHQGQGLASAATAEVCALAANEFGLHRIQAGTLLHNHGSQKVLDRAGFTRIGVAAAYLRIDDAWQDHILFQRLLDD